MSDLLTDSQFTEFRKLIYDSSGITFSETNRSILDSRLKERLRDMNLDNLDAYYKIITSDKEEFKVFLDSITTNLTRFFRNQPHFDALINYVIPHVIENKKNCGGNASGAGDILDGEFLECRLFNWRRTIHSSHAS